MSPHGKYKHNSFQMQVGDAGYEAIRLVRKGGVILWRKERYQSDTLLPYVGQEIFLWDWCGGINVFEGGWNGANKPITWGDFIVKDLTSLEVSKCRTN